MTQMNWLHWALLSALFAGLTAVLAKAGVKGIDSNLATAIRTVVILVFAWSIAFARGFDTLGKATTRTWLFLVLSGLATGASWLCYFRALQLGEASKVAPVDKLSVVVAMVLAMFFLGEHLTWRHWVGAGFIVTGTVIIAKI
jgi:transporter family protein